jgi:branched-subunit amino acid aminotransferase/4-amino-4-deoxychorismate lyase
MTPAELRKTEGVFLSMSSWGIVEVTSLDGSELRQSARVRQIREAYAGLLESECG